MSDGPGTPPGLRRLFNVCRAGDEPRDPNPGIRACTCDDGELVSNSTIGGGHVLRPSAIVVLLIALVLGVPAAIANPAGKSAKPR